MPVISDIVTTTRASTGTYWDADGVMQTAANNVWRMDHDPVTGAPLGVLIEEARTNLAQWSGDLTNGAYGSIGGATVVSSVVVAPDGIGTFARVVEAAATNTFGRSQTLDSTALPNDTEHWYSVFVKAAERTRCLVQQNNFINFSTRSAVVVDLTNGSIIDLSGTTSPDARVQDCGNGVYRISIKGVTSTNGGLRSFTVGPRLNDATTPNTYEGDGVSGIYAWGYQIEIGAFPTSYIPTTTAAATRVADRLSVAIGGWAGDNLKGSLLVDVNMRNPGNAAISNQLPHIASFQKDGGLSGDYRAIRITQPRSVRAIVGNNGVFTDSGELLAAGDGQRFRVAFAGEGTDIAAVANGGTIRPITSRQWGSDNNALFIGSQSGVTRFWNGHVRSITYYPRRLSDSELQAATVLS